jgi:lipoate-protein ligase A
MKLEAKGVKSVVSRVTNLGLQNPELNVRPLSTPRRSVSRRVRHGGAARGRIRGRRETGAGARAVRSWDWRFGCTPSFNVSFENSFRSDVSNCSQVQGGIVSSVVCYTDAMDATLALRLQELLTGCVYGKQPLVERLGSQSGAEVKEIAAWLNEQSI